MHKKRLATGLCPGPLATGEPQYRAYLLCLHYGNKEIWRESKIAVLGINTFPAKLSACRYLLPAFRMVSCRRRRQQQQQILSQSVIDAARIVRRPHCMQSSVYVTVQRPSVCPIDRQQQRLPADGGQEIQIGSFGRRRSAANGAAARRSAANAGRVMLTAESTRLNTDLAVVRVKINVNVVTISFIVSLQI